MAEKASVHSWWQRYKKAGSGLDQLVEVLFVWIMLEGSIPPWLVVLHRVDSYEEAVPQVPWIC